MFDYKTDTFMGEPAHKVARFLTAAKRHGVDLDKLATKIAKDGDLEVYDSINPARLLGVFKGAKKVMGRPGTDRLYASARFAAHASPAFDEPVTADVHKAEFTLEWRASPDGWSRLPVLLTSTPLAVLMRVHGFELPEECSIREGYRRF